MVKNNQFENKNRKKHTNRKRDKVLVRNKKKNVWGTVHMPLSDNPIMDKRKYHHISGRLKRAHKYQINETL